MPRAANDHDITQALGLSRPLSEYAPRTQRRYRAAYRAGLDREEALREERAKRATQPATRIQRATRALRRLGVTDRGSHDPDNIERLAEGLGSKTAAAEWLEAQLQATQVYKETGDSQLGQGLAHRRGLVSQSMMMDLKPYTYYHPYNTA